jgi:hypothetical protein
MNPFKIATDGLLGDTLEIAVRGLLSTTDVVDVPSGGSRIVFKDNLDDELLLIASSFTTILNKRF